MAIDLVVGSDGFVIARGDPEIALVAVALPVVVAHRIVLVGAFFNALVLLVLLLWGPGPRARPIVYFEQLRPLASLHLQDALAVVCLAVVAAHWSHLLGAHLLGTLFNGGFDSRYLPLLHIILVVVIRNRAEVVTRVAVAFVAHLKARVPTASNHVQLTLAGVHLTVVAADYSIASIIWARLDAICNMMLLLSILYLHQC